jgi:hypothetical protein
MGWQFYVIGVGNSVFKGTFRIKIWVEQGTGDETDYEDREEKPKVEEKPKEEKKIIIEANDNEPKNKKSAANKTANLNQTKNKTVLKNETIDNDALILGLNAGALVSIIVGALIGCGCCTYLVLYGYM